jgi:hypothetical protein
MKSILILILCCFPSFSFAFESEIVLQNTIRSYVKGSENLPYVFSYSSTMNRLFHNTLPLQKSILKASGKFQLSESIFQKSETIKSGNNIFNIEFQYDGKDVLSKNVNDTTFQKQSRTSLLEQPITLCTFTLFRF